MDYCIDSNGRIIPEFKEVIELIKSYTEISVSGHGIHIVAKTNNWLPEIRQDKYKNGYFELFISHFITFSGNHIEGTPKEIICNDSAISTFYDKYIKTSSDKKTPESKSKNIPFLKKLSDDEIISKMLKSKKQIILKKTMELGYKRLWG
jgi:putative DNA primase/helicase